MSDPLNRPNPELEAALNGIHDASDLRQTLLQVLETQGVLTATRDSEFNTHLRIRQSQTPDPTLPAGFRYEKEITFNPESGRRNLMIRANSMEDLTALENQILGQ